MDADEAGVRRRLAARKQQRTRDNLSEGLFEQQVLGLARLLGWKAHHVRDSRHVLMGDIGYPDWTFAKGGNVIIAELKRESGHLTDAQEEWLSDLGWPPGSQWLQSGRLQVYVWRPSDMDQGRIQAVFQGTMERGE